jgi:hypothetical protein
VKLSGLFVAVFGVLVCTQVLAGEALQRLKIV